MVAKFLDDNNRTFLQRRRRTAKKGLHWQKNIFARASRFFVHFLAVVARRDKPQLVKDGLTGHH